MRLTKALLAASVAAVMASQAVAGGFAPIIAEPAPVVVTEPMAPRSTFGILLPLALLGALAALALASDDESDTSND